jgi:prepilin signal peptidase PulO-like enzyme (type II secretory pathway)
VPRKAPLGADLVIPLLAVGFATYFFWSIAELSWEAKANGVLIGTLLVGLVAIQLVRIGRQLAAGTGDLGMDALWRPRDALGKRIGMVLLAAAFIALLDWLGLTLALLVAMALALRLMGIRKPATLAWVSCAVAGTAYVLFVAILDSAFPHGPIEHLLARLFV